MEDFQVASVYRLDYDDMEYLLQESTVDFPHESLPKDIWVMVDKKFHLIPDVRRTIEKSLQGYKDFDILNNAEDIRIVGSSATNLYEDNSDLDVHVVLKTVPEGVEELQKRVKRWSHKNPQYVGSHPIEIYIQNNPAQDFMSASVYSLTKDAWLKGPYLVDSSYNPYDVYEDAFKQVKDYVEQADEHLAELRRDVIDYRTMRLAYSRLPIEKREALLSYLNDKLEEVEQGIDDLLKDKKEWVEMRRSSPVPASEEQALKDVEFLRRTEDWQETNAVFKAIDRYGYIKLISELEAIIDPEGEGDRELDHEDMGDVEQVVSQDLQVEGGKA